MVYVSRVLHISIYFAFISHVHLYGSFQNLIPAQGVFQVSSMADYRPVAAATMAVHSCPFFFSFLMKPTPKEETQQQTYWEGLKRTKNNMFQSYLAGKSSPDSLLAKPVAGKAFHAGSPCILSPVTSLVMLSLLVDVCNRRK